MSGMPFSPWREMLLEPGVRKHFVLVYKTDAHLASCVAAWTARSLTTGGGAILVGREAYRDDILREIRLLGVDVEARMRSGRLAVLDAEETLTSVLHGGSPDPERFRALLHETVGKVRKACGDPHADIRAWGEMVSLLHESSRAPIAHELEALWDRFLAQERVRLLCSYKLGAVRDLADACETHATLLVESGDDDVEETASRVLSQLFGEELPGRAMSHVLRRGALPIGGPPPTALLLPLEGWQRPTRAS